FGVPDGVDTVIGRVTGGEASRLDGRVSFVDPAFAAPRAADFWFFNPAGVLIGPDAEFRTSGALRFSGGDGMIFADGARLTANLADGLTLTSAAPAAFGFFDADPGPVIVRGAALPAQGAGIALAGGEVVIDRGVLFSETGGDLVLVAGGRGDAADVRAAPTAAPGAGVVRLIGAEPGTLRVDGPLASTAGGAIVIAGGTVELTGPGDARTEALAGPGGDVIVRAGELTLSDGAAIGTLTAGVDRAGDVDVIAGRGALLRGAAILSQTLGEGDAGDVSVSGFSSLFLSRDGTLAETVIESEVSRGATGNAGLVAVSGDELRLEDGGRIFSATVGAGDAGEVQVDVGRLTVRSGGQIGVGALDAPDLPGRTTGAGGSLFLTAREEMTFAGLLPETVNKPGIEPEPSGVFSASEDLGSGPGGNLTISAPLIVMTDEAEIGAETFFDAPAGDIVVTGGSLFIDGGAELSTSSRRAGRAGTLEVTMTEGVFVGRDGGIASRAPGVGGEAGGVFLTAGELRVGERGRITTESGSADGGRISVFSDRLTVIDGGVLTTSVGGADGDGGAIGVEGGPLILAGGALLASTAVLGDGGEVVIGSSFSLIETGSRIDVSSLAGADGVVSFLGVVGDQTTETEAPPAEFFNRFALIDDFCVAAVTGGSALRLEGPRQPAGGGARAPALFGGAVPFPGGEATAAALALPEEIAVNPVSHCLHPS
ncbi:MAG: hypothetical protein AAGF90_18965, partial [Pseudomonadota bacterium]